MLSLIAAIGRNRELGKDNQLIFRIPEDMQYFKDTTMGHRVLMGRKTWGSLPGKLPGRTNIVVSRNPVTGADVSVSDLKQFIEENRDTPEEIFVIGGGMVYFETLPYAKHLYLTEVDATAEADSWFPAFDTEDWEREEIMSGKSGDLDYKVIKYTRKEVK